jgi:hypothetical protein
MAHGGGSRSLREPRHDSWVLALGRIAMFPTTYVACLVAHPVLLYGSSSMRDRDFSLYGSMRPASLYPNDISVCLNVGTRRRKQLATKPRLPANLHRKPVSTSLTTAWPSVVAMIRGTQPYEMHRLEIRTQIPSWMTRAIDQGKGLRLVCMRISIAIGHNRPCLCMGFGHLPIF